MRFISLKKKILRNIYSLNEYREIQHIFQLMNKPQQMAGLLLYLLNEAQSTKEEGI